MIGSRTRLSLAQFLELQEYGVCTVLLNKYGIDSSLYPSQLLFGLKDLLSTMDQHRLLMLMDEIVRTDGDLRARVNPKYRFDERWADLTRCLVLDGYLVSGKQLIPIDPSISDAAAIDDDLIRELKACGAPRANEIIRKINDSSDAFRASPPNYNACLNDARVALETLAVDISQSRNTSCAAPADVSKWGSVISHLRMGGLITLEEERGLVGVYGFVSPGSHRPIGVSDEQMARLGRSFALNMCWFLLKRQQAMPN